MSSPPAGELSPPRATLLYVVNDYDPERDGELLGAGDVCRLMHVSRSHLPNLRANRTLYGYKQHQKGHWKYPSLQPALVEARAALQSAREARS